MIYIMWRAILFLSLVAFSCSNGNQINLIAVGSVSFDVGFLTNFRFRGIIYDIHSGENLFYFADPVTYKQIKFFDGSGELQYTTPLNKAVDALASIEDIQAISSDSILIFGKQNNQICLINHEGNIVSKLNISKIVENEQDSIYVYRTSFSGKSLSGHSILFHSEFIQKLDKYPSMQSYFKESLNHPYFCKVDNIFKDSIT